MRELFKKSICFTTILILSMILDSRTDLMGCTPDTVRSVLIVKPYYQEQTLWCWAACGQMVMQYLDPSKSIDQCDEANKNYSPHRTICCPEQDGVCNKGGWPKFRLYGFTAKHTNNSALLWDQVKDQIDCKKAPFCMTWKYSGGGGHMLVVCGYKVESGDQVYVINPEDQSGARWIPYSTYRNGPPGASHWDDYYDIKK